VMNCLEPRPFPGEQMSNGGWRGDPNYERGRRREEQAMQMKPKSSASPSTNSWHRAASQRALSPFACDYARSGARVPPRLRRPRAPRHDSPPGAGHPMEAQDGRAVPRPRRRRLHESKKVFAHSPMDRSGPKPSVLKVSSVTRTRTESNKN